MSGDGDVGREAGLDELNRALVEQAGDGIFLAEKQGVYVQVNKSGHRLLGYADGELIGRRITDIIRPEDASKLQAEIEDLQRGHVRTGTWTLVRIDGTLLEAEVVAQMLSNGLILGIVRDLSAHAREKYVSRELFQRMQKIAGQVPGVVYQFKQRPDGSTCFPYASERIREIYRVTPEEVVEDASKVFSILHPEDFDGIVASITKSAETMQPWKHEYRVKFPDGVVRWLFGNAVPERDLDGSTLWHGFITDVTERKQAEAASARLEAQLRQSQKEESIGRLAGGVAHDFNNLLTSILGFAELAQADIPLGSTAAQDLAGIVEAAQRGAALTQRILAFARKQIVQPEVVDLNGVLTRLLPMVERLVGEDIELLVQLLPRVEMVLVDVGSIEQAIINLVVNARDAMPAGGHLTLEVSSCDVDEQYANLHSEVTPGSYVTLSVSDTGTGMSSEVQSRLFEPFFTTKAVGQGTGLGLAMCYGIVKQAGGHMSFHSEPGSGSCFTVYLRRTTAAISDSKPTSPAPVAARGSETILLVEDEASILVVAREALSRRGYRVLSAENGARALELVERDPEPIHLLVTDVVMPKMGGQELAARLGKIRPGLKVLYTSGYAEHSIVNQGTLDPGIHFLRKPYTLNLLAQQVRQILDGV